MGCKTEKNVCCVFQINGVRYAKWYKCYNMHLSQKVEHVFFNENIERISNLSPIHITTTKILLKIMII